MTNSLLLKKVLIISFYFISIFSQFLFAQSDLDEEYQKIKNSSLDSISKILKIESWIKEKNMIPDSAQFGRTLRDFGKFCFKNKLPNKAIIYGKEALKFLPPKEANKSYNHLYYFYKDLGEEEKAISFLKELIRQPYKDQVTILSLTNELKNYALKIGDYYQALEYIQEAEQIISTQKDSILNKEYYKILLEYSIVYIKLGTDKNYKKAIKYLKEADSLNRNKTHIKNQIIIDNRFGRHTHY